VQFQTFPPGRLRTGDDIYSTLVKASGRGVPSDKDRLAEELSIALESSDISIDVREVDDLNEDAMRALTDVAARVQGWPSGRLFVLVRAGDLDGVTAALSRYSRTYVEA
jgi:hypothetical protein